MILVRHMPFDPFVLAFGKMFRRRATVHHSKEIEELLWVRPDWRGRAAAALERVAGWWNVRTVAAVIGVTPEIATFQMEVHKQNVPAGFYPNGIDLTTVGILEDRRAREEAKVAFVCSTFASWHGLDLLLEAAKRSDQPLERPLAFFLVGKLTEEQLREVESISHPQVKFVICGSLDQEEYEEILARCDIGLGSLALERKGLAEATTLKVREYLAQGLAVYSGHVDSALPDDFPFYRRGSGNLEDIVAYAVEAKDFSRKEVRTSSAPFIRKQDIMQRLYDWLQRTASERGR